MIYHWIPGWQFDQQAYQPLLKHMSTLDAQVLNYHSQDISRQQWLQRHAQALPHDVTLVGWSLGGMLACELAARSENVKQVLVINANVRFSGANGLPKAIAEDFRRRYRENTALTKRRFAQLVDAQQAKTLENLLVPGDQGQSLDWLYDIDLENFKPNCPVHVLLSEQDQLVPTQKAAQAWSSIAESVTSIAGEHGQLITDYLPTAQWIAAHG